MEPVACAWASQPRTRRRWQPLLRSWRNSRTPQLSARHRIPMPAVVHRFHRGDGDGGGDVGDDAFGALRLHLHPSGSHRHSSPWTLQSLQAADRQSLQAVDRRSLRTAVRPLKSPNSQGCPRLCASFYVVRHDDALSSCVWALLRNPGSRSTPSAFSASFSASSSASRSSGSSSLSPIEAAARLRSS